MSALYLFLAGPSSELPHGEHLCEAYIRAIRVLPCSGGLCFLVWTSFYHSSLKDHHNNNLCAERFCAGLEACEADIPFYRRGSQGFVR